jgi:hypothetical protein
MNKFKNTNKKIATILLTLFIAALAVFNMNIAKSNTGEIILPSDIEQVEALADTEIVIVTYTITEFYFLSNGTVLIRCKTVSYIAICDI